MIGETSSYHSRVYTTIKVKVVDSAWESVVAVVAGHVDHFKVSGFHVACDIVRGEVGISHVHFTEIVFLLVTGDVLAVIYPVFYLVRISIIISRYEAYEFYPAVERSSGKHTNGVILLY